MTETIYIYEKGKGWVPAESGVIGQFTTIDGVTYSVIDRAPKVGDLWDTRSRNESWEQYLDHATKTYMSTWILPFTGRYDRELHTLVKL